MCRAYGARQKGTDKTIYDQYPLERLVQLLCFEDADEARAACQHYNITVEKINISSSSDPTKTGVMDVIFWKRSDFKEPKHPEKGFVLPLPPKKMMRTIEKKLAGVTRLAVCRGEVSGEGAVLTDVKAPGISPKVASELTPQQKAQLEREEAEAKAKAAALQMKQKQERARLEAEAKEKEAKNRLAAEQRAREEAERKKVELQRLQEEKRKQQLEAQKKAEIERQLAEKERQEQEQEKARQAELEAEKQRKEEEEARIAEEERQRQVEAERQRKLEEEAERKRREAEEQRRREEEERLRLEVARKKAEEDRKRREEEERQRQIEAAKRREILRRQEEERKRRLAEERRIEAEWQQRISSAQKLLLWRRWRQQARSLLEKSQALSLSAAQIDPTFSNPESPFLAALDKELSQPHASRNIVPPVHIGVYGVLEKVLKDETTPVDLPKYVLDHLNGPGHLSVERAGEEKDQQTFLLKVAIILPHPKDLSEANTTEIIMMALNKQLGLGKVQSARLFESHSQTNLEARTVAIIGETPEQCSGCDAALLIVPPQWCSEDRLLDLQEAASRINGDIPRVALVLKETTHGHSDVESINAMVASCCAGDFDAISIVHPREVSSFAYSNAVESCFKSLAKQYITDSSVGIDRIPAVKLGADIVRSALWQDFGSFEIDNGKDVIDCAKVALKIASEELKQFHMENQSVWTTWPSREFAVDGEVPGFFSPTSPLPLDWGERSSEAGSLTHLADLLNGSFRDVIDRLLARAPLDTVNECDEMVAKGFYRRCLEQALFWQVELDGFGDQSYLYFPSGTIQLIVDSTGEKFKQWRETKEREAREKLQREELLLAEMQRENDPPTRENVIHGMNSPVSVPVEAEKSVVLKNSAKSNKRFREDSDFLHRPSPSAPSASPHQSEKRQRSEISADLEESIAFTKRLEKLVHGDTIDMAIGETSLAELLKGAPKLDML